MSYDSPRTVTFNAPPQDEAQYRSARLGSRVIGATLGVAAIILTGVALLWSLNFAVSLAATWGEVLKLGLIAVGGTLALAGLPVASALLSRAYPYEAQWAMQLWLYAMGIAAIGLAVFVLTLSPADAPSSVLNIQPAVTQSDVFRLENRVQDNVWYYSNGCTAPQDGFQTRHCRDVIEARLAVAGADARQAADSDEVARLFRFVTAHDSDFIPPMFPRQSRPGHGALLAV